MNYVQLRAAIQEYALDFEPSFADNVDNFIRNAEGRILLKVRLPRFRKDVVASAVQGEALLMTPTDFLAPDSLMLFDGTRKIILLNKDQEFLDECYPDTDYEAEPRFYTMQNERMLRMAPTPWQDYPATLGYFFEAPSITAAGQTWLGDHFAHTLLSGSLLEAALFQKAEDNIYQRYYQQFQEDLAMDKDEYAKGRTKKDTYQEPDARKPI